jgi:hypothetical protein
MLLGARATCAMFGWAEPTTLGDLLGAVREEATASEVGPKG